MDGMYQLLRAFEETFDPETRKAIVEAMLKGIDAIVRKEELRERRKEIMREGRG